MPRKFAVGDKVRVRMDRVPKGLARAIGRRRVGAVERFECGGVTTPYWVCIGGDLNQIPFRARELELVTRKGAR